MSPSHPTRLPLARSGRRLSFERRLLLWLALLALPTLALAGVLAARETHSLPLAALVLLPLLLAASLAISLLLEQIIRPLQTLSNIVAALREDDFSFRARGARRGDSLGDLALEINALAATLQSQRAAANDALSLAEQVMRSMQSPVLAFGPAPGSPGAAPLRLLNPAAAQAFSLTVDAALGQSAAALHLAPLLLTPDQHLFPPELPPAAHSAAPPPGSTPRWSVRRSTFRLHGLPHTLFVLTDVALALQQEERLAWQRLIRVLSHEINNSLTPIQSIAGSLRVHHSHAAAVLSPDTPDLDRGLRVIEDRAASLHRFLAAYQQLTHLPPPTLRPVPLQPLLERLVTLEVRLPITLRPGPPLTLHADPDQLDQLLINLLRNAVEAALTLPPKPTVPAAVTLSWHASSTHLLLHISDTGPGLANPANLFVPFYTTKEHGSGIGLVLAQQIASAHGGLIRLTNNQPPPGCTAELRLPLHPAAP